MSSSCSHTQSSLLLFLSPAYDFTGLLYNKIDQNLDISNVACIGINSDVVIASSHRQGVDFNSYHLSSYNYKQK